MLMFMVVLILKGGNNYRRIDLLEMTWKVLERVLGRRLKEVHLRDTLHGFQQKQGCGTGIMHASFDRVF